MHAENRPGWVEFAPVWSVRLGSPSDGYSEEVIRKVFALAIANYNGKLSEAATLREFRRLQYELKVFPM